MCEKCIRAMNEHLDGMPVALRRNVLMDLTAYPLSTIEETERQLKAIGERVRPKEPGWEERLSELFREDELGKLLTEALK